MVSDALLLVSVGADQTNIAAAEQWLSSQGVERVIIRDRSSGSASAVKSIEEEGFEGSFLVVELGSPAVNLKALEQAHTESWSCATFAADQSGQPLGVYLFEFRIFDYIPRDEAMELPELLEKLREQDEAVLSLAA